MSAEQTMTPAQGGDRALYVLLTVVFINIAGFGMIIPLLPFFAQAFGAPVWAVFVLFSAYSVGNFIAEPIWGRLSDRIGRRPVLMITILGNGLTYVMLAFAPDIVTATVIRLVSGMLSGNISTIQGCMADITPPHKRASRMGLLGAAFSMGFVTGPAIGGLLARPELGAVGFRPPMLLAASLCALSFLGVVLFVRESRRTRADAPRPTHLEGIRHALETPAIWRVICVSLIAALGFAGIEASFGLWADAKFGWGPREIGLCFLLIGVTAAFGQGAVAGRLARRIGEARALMCGLAIYAVAAFAQPWMGIGALAAGSMIVLAMGQALMFPNISALISIASPPDRQGEMLGLNMSAMALSRIVGPLAAAPLFALAVDAPFIVSGFLTFPAIWLTWKVSRAVVRKA